MDYGILFETVFLHFCEKIQPFFLPPAQNVKPAKISVVLAMEMLYTFYIGTFDGCQLPIAACWAVSTA